MNLPVWEHIICKDTTDLSHKEECYLHGVVLPLGPVPVCRLWTFTTVSDLSPLICGSSCMRRGQHCSFFKVLLLILNHIVHGKIPLWLKKNMKSAAQIMCLTLSAVAFKDTSAWEKSESLQTRKVMQIKQVMNLHICATKSCGTKF